MNNRIQQRFDCSIREAVKETKRVNDAKPRRDVRHSRSTKHHSELKGRLYLCPETGATIWEPWHGD